VGGGSISHNGSGLEEVADLTDKIMNGATQFDYSQMLISGTKPAIYLSPCYLLPPSTNFNTKDKKKIQKLF